MLTGTHTQRLKPKWGRRHDSEGSVLVWGWGAALLASAAPSRSTHDVAAALAAGVELRLVVALLLLLFFLTATIVLLVGLAFAIHFLTVHGGVLHWLRPAGGEDMRIRGTGGRASVGGGSRGA